MPTLPKLVAFAGSTREQSFNKKLIQQAAASAEKAGASVTVVDLRDFALPLYDGDLERKQGIPEKALQLRQLFASANGMLIASPEYNGSYSAVLKNIFDWVSRPTETDASMSAFRNKVVGIMSASPGNLGGLRGLAQLRVLMTMLSTIVVPEQLAVGRAHEAFTDSGSLRDDKTITQLIQLTSRVVELASLIAAR